MADLQPVSTETQEYSDVGLIDTPVLGMAENPELANFNALKAAFLDNYTTGTPVIESFQNHIGNMNPEGNLQDLAIQKQAADAQAVVDVLSDIAVQDPDVYVESVQAASELKQEIDQDLQNADPTAVFIDTIKGDELTPEQQAAVTNYAKLYELLQESTAEITGGDIALDLLSEITPFVSTASEASLTGSVFGNEEIIQRAIFNFKQLPFEEQQARFPALRDEVLDKLGEIRGVETLKKFIEPTGDEELGDFSNWWKVIDAVDMTAIGAVGVSAIRAFKTSFNMPKLLARAENEELAGDAVTTAMASPEAAKAMNIKQDTAAGDAIAFDTSVEDIAHTGNISSESLKSIDEFFGKADATAEEIMAGDGYLREGILNSIERAAREKGAYEQILKAQHEQIQITGRTENTTSFKYRAKDDNGEWFDDEYTLDLTLDDVGQWDQSEIMTLSDFLNSPTVFAKGITKLDVRTAERLDDQTAKVFRDLTELQREAVKPLGNLLKPKNRKSLSKVERALREGDEYKDEVSGIRGAVFDPDTLKGTYHLDDREMEAYYNTNRLYNNLWRLRNNAKREEMIAFKYKQVDLLDEDYSFGTPFKAEGEALNSMRQHKVSSIFDVNRDRVISTNIDKYVETGYALGKQLVRLPEPYQAGAGRGKFTYVFVDNDAVGELPAVVLNRKRGYVPKINEDGHWFVKEIGDDVVDGQEVSTVVRTHRYFDNKADAETFREDLITKDMEELGLTRKQAEAKYKNFEDREQEIIATATGQFSHGSGGFYTAARAQDDILFGLNGDAAKRTTPYEALVRNIANVSRMVPINQWRLGLEQRWLNTARELTGEDIRKFGQLPETVESTRAGEFLNKMAKQIRDWQGFPSKEEQIYNSMTQRLHEWALKNDKSGGAKLTGWMRDKDPVSSARAAAFHSLLGWFNPAQLWVQAQGMSVAVSINLGKRLTETLRHTTGLTTLGLSDEIADGRWATAAKVAGIDKAELQEMHRLWKKSGLEDSILQTADHAAGVRGHGIAMDAVSQAADKGLFFYRHGELLNRRMSFTTALDELKAGELAGFEDFVKGSEVTDDALKAVMDRTHNLMLNLSKANRAQWQKGLASVPTQFFQVSAKALETVGGFNDNLKTEERLRMMAGQIALYGTAGIPLINFASNYLLEVMGVTQEDIEDNPLLTKTWNDGFWGFTTLGIFGVDAEVSARGSLARGVTDFIDNWMFSESTVGVKLMGAFGSTGQRFWDSFTAQMKPISFGVYPSNIVDIAKIPTMPFLESVSTWRNGEKAVFMQLIDKILAKNGDPTVQRGFEIRESVAAAIGFQLSDETKIYSLNERSQHAQQVNQRTADMIIKMMNKAVVASEAGTWSEEDQLEHEQNLALIFGGLEWNDQKTVRDSVKRRLTGDTKEVRAIKQYIKKVGNNTTDGLSVIQALLGTNVQSLSREQEED